MGLVMDIYSSGEDSVIKARKPYTITKQRERWTDEEHNRFLEALKLYGRAWQRIEEHIGTKTAVQIRSHAQKFFSKLEKGVLVKGVAIGQALDIDIPPPRPKRKPSNPYPRKTCVGVPLTQVGPEDGNFLMSVAPPHCKQVLDLEKEPLREHFVDQRPAGDGNPTNEKENNDDDCSEVFNLIQEAHCSSVSSVNKTSVQTSQALRNSCPFMEVKPLHREGETQNETNEYFTMERKGNQKLDKCDGKQTVQDNDKTEFSNIESPVQNLSQYKKSDNSNCTFPTDEMEASHNYPRHVSVQIVDTNIGPSTQTPLTDMSFGEAIPQPSDHGHPNLFPNPAASSFTEHRSSSTKSSVHQPFSTFHPPFTTVCQNQDDYQSSLRPSSTFSSLIVSTLLQNPAAHAAASFAQFCQYASAETSVDSPANTRGVFPPSQMNLAPSMAAIASATVAAATAWWAANGLLPWCSPLQSAFTCSPALTNVIPSVETGQDTALKAERRENTTQRREPARSEAFQPQQSAFKSSALSSSDTEIRGAKIHNGSKAFSNHEKAAAVTELHDPNKTEGRKPVYRSSCGSNTASSSEVEADALEKHEKVNEEQNDPDANNPAAESSRRTRSATNFNDSWNDTWKEVSEGGRLAFQALFTGDRLPQSFPPHSDLKKEQHQMINIVECKNKIDEKNGDAMLLDLNSKTWGSCSGHQDDRKGDVLTMGLGHGKLKFCRTGFKPYKRCSMEAKEIMVPNASRQGEEKCPKRIRLEGEATRDI